MIPENRHSRSGSYLSKGEDRGTFPLSISPPICRLWSTSSSSPACSGVLEGSVCVPGGGIVLSAGTVLGVNSVRGTRKAADAFKPYVVHYFVKAPLKLKLKQNPP